MARDNGVRWRPSRQQSGWLLTLSVAVAVGSSTLPAWTQAPWWIVVTLSSLAVIGASVVTLLARQASYRDAHDYALEASVRSAAETGLLRPIDQVTLTELGVHRAQIQVPYVDRDAQAEAREILRVGRPLLILGHAMAGKSRMGAELLRRHFGDRLLVAPSPPTGLADLISAGATLTNTAIWLDDLERYLGHTDFRVEWLDRAVRADNVIVATMRASVYETFLPTRTQRSARWELLERFSPVWIRHDSTERLRISPAIADPVLRASVERYGLAEYVGGGVLAVERFNAGETLHPLGAAMVRAAADWRRAGLEVIPEPTLVNLTAAYVSSWLRDPAIEAVADALAWASEPIDDTVSLIEPTVTGWRAFDYIVAHLATRATPIPDSVWPTIIDAAGEQLTTVGYVAATVHHRLDIAEHAWRRAAQQTGDETAMVNLGLLLERRGELEQATQWYLRAAGHHDDVTAAMLKLGLLSHQPADRSALLPTRSITRRRIVHRLRHPPTPRLPHRRRRRR